MAAPIEDDDDEGEMIGEQPPRRTPESQSAQAPEETYLNDDDLLGVPEVDGEPRQQEESLAERQETLLDQRRDHEHKRDRRERQKAARDRSQQELQMLRRKIEELSGQVADVHPRLSQVDADRHRAQVAEVERAIEYHAQRAHAARQAMSTAMVSGDPEGMTKALDARDEAIIKHQQLQAQRQMMMQNLPPQQDHQARPPAPAPMPRAVQQRIEDFQRDFDWYNPRDPRDLDSKIVLQLDNAIAAEGFEPGTDDYWDELRDRMSRYLPHRFEQEHRPQQQQQARQQQPAAPQNRRGPMAAAPSERPAPTRQQNSVAPELARGRREALVAAGVIDRDGRIYNRAKYDSYVKKFKEYDRDNSGAVR